MDDGRLRLVFVVCVALVTSVGCGGDSDGNNADGSVGLDGTVEPDGNVGIDAAGIGPGGGTVTGDGATAEIPADALTTTTDIGVAIATPGVALPDGVEAVGQIFAFTPHGTTFSKTVTLTLPHTGTGTDTLSVLRLDNDSDLSWEAVAGASFNGSTATVGTTTFSYYRVVRATETGTPCGDGLGILDSANSSLCWEKSPLTTPSTFIDAYNHCLSLGVGQWSVPLVDELEGLIPAGACPVLAGCTVQSSVPVCTSATDCENEDCSTGCTANAGPGPSGCYWESQYTGACGPHWSNNTLADVASDNWLLDFANATLISAARSEAVGVTRCVIRL